MKEKLETLLDLLNRFSPEEKDIILEIVKLTSQVAQSPLSV